MKENKFKEKQFKIWEFFLKESRREEDIFSSFFLSQTQEAVERILLSHFYSGNFLLKLPKLLLLILPMLGSFGLAYLATQQSPNMKNKWMRMDEAEQIMFQDLEKMRINGRESEF